MDKLISDLQAMQVSLAAITAEVQAMLVVEAPVEAVVDASVEAPVEATEAV